MKNELPRREFLKSTAIISGAFASHIIWPFKKVFAETSKPDIAVAKCNKVPKTTRAAIDALGGIKQFVNKGDRVVLLPNPQGRQTGTSTSAEVIAETITMCLEAGAAEVAICSIHGPGRWQHTGVIEATKKAGGIMVYPNSEKDWVRVEIPKGKLLKKTKIIKRAFENDVLINMPIAKHHRSTRFTCNLKNLMGFNDDNNWFHQGEEHLQQSIVDLASIFSPDLNIVDAHTILIENGPFGPGATSSPKRIYAGIDMVAVDALCCGLINLEPRDVGHILGAYKLGLGQIDLSKLTVKELQV